MSTDESSGAELRVEPADDSPAEFPSGAPAASPFESFVGSLHENASVRRVFGDPVERGDRTVVPVARVAYGFGGGSGEGGTEEDGSGWGGGGGLQASPVGALEVTDDETRFVRFDDRRGVVGAVAVGLLAGFLLGRRGRTPPAPTRSERMTGPVRAAGDAASRRARSIPTAASRRVRSGAMQRLRSAGTRVRAVRRTD